MGKQTRFITMALLIGIIFCSCGSAFATVPATGTTVTFMGNNNWQFEPIPSNLNDLDHSYAYTWGIDYTVPAGQFVDFASITFTDINNWQYEPDANVLYVNLLDSATVGVATDYDGQASGNFFAPGALELVQYVDNSPAFETFTYTFNQEQLTALNTALAGNNFGIGFDPDCHYFNKGIKMDITTKVVPEPISCVLFVIGSGVLGGVLRKRRHA